MEGSNGDLANNHRQCGELSNAIALKASCRNRETEDPRRAEPRLSNSICVCVSPPAIAGGYRLAGAVNGAQASFLLDTAMLLREDVWTRVTARSPQELKPWPVLKLVNVGGTPLNVHGSACVKLELEGEKFSTEVVIVSPLPSEAILGLDFLQEQQAMIYLASKKLCLRGRGFDLPLRDSTPLRVRSEQPVLAV